ncbi:heat-inducible transcription repressor HrcA [Thermoleophilia bacterium SCSIO 60948]|nr:heat-inducible transcription repressor HrcA [Thermoleophilia bacterium SCSIO 60948]
MLTERQSEILRLVVGDYLECGRPVGSKAIASRADVTWSPSTIRSELAALEAEGFLDHPHTSAGRVPTDAGYRVYTDHLLERPANVPAKVRSLDLTEVRREVDEAMRETTSALAQANNLLALASAPPHSTAQIHRIEVLRPQSRVVTVVVIASNGAVAKRVFTFEGTVDPGLVEWASEYLNEKLAGRPIAASVVARCLADPELGPSETTFLAQISGAVTGLEEAGEDQLYVTGTGRLLAEENASHLPEASSLVRTLERRAGVLSLLRSALDERSVFVWIGSENPSPELREVSIVGANYGLGYRNLGTVGVVGPMRMDYETAIGSVREAAGTLSRFFETVYEG